MQDTGKRRAVIIEISPGSYNVPPAGYGGSERSIFGIAKGLNNLIPVLIINFGDSFSTGRSEGVPTLTLRNPVRFKNRTGLLFSGINAITSALSLFSFCIRNKRRLAPTILHFHHSIQFVVFWYMEMLFIRSKRVSFVFSCHSPRWMNPDLIPLWQRLLAIPTELSSMSKSDLLTLESQPVALGVRRVWTKPLRFVILPNGVDTKFFDSRRYDGREMEYGVLYAARIKRQKNQIAVVRAFAEVVKAIPQARLLLLGSHEEVDYLRSLQFEIGRLGIGQNVTLSPSVSIQKLDEIRATYPIHLVYSSYTGFDVAVGESLSFGKACVFSDIPPIRGIVRSGFDCMLVQPNNEKSLATALLFLLHNPNERLRLGVNARKTAERELSWDILAKRFFYELEPSVHKLENV